MLNLLLLFIKRSFRCLFLLALILLSYNVVSATTPSPSPDEVFDTPKKEFNAGEMVMHHVADAHEWHIFEWNGKAVALPLPIILYDKNKGFSVFSSSNFHEGEADYNGYRLNDKNIVAVNAVGELDEVATAGLYDFSITKNALAIFVCITIMLLIFISVARSYKKRGLTAPKGLQSFMEPIILFVKEDIAKTNIGSKHYERFVPFLLTLFFFIWINNLLGLIPLIPGGANVTGNVAIPIVLAAFTFIITTINGRKHYWRHIFAMPGVPIGVLPLISVLEFAGIFIKPIVLVIRLFANIFSGHIALLVFFGLIFIAGVNSTEGGFGVAIGSTLFTVFLNFLELLVGSIQAYVFTLLSALYIGMAVSDGH